jgi:hypothetical protein
MATEARLHEKELCIGLLVEVEPNDANLSIRVMRCSDMGEVVDILDNCPLFD